MDALSRFEESPITTSEAPQDDAGAMGASMRGDAIGWSFIGISGAPNPLAIRLLPGRGWGWLKDPRIDASLEWLEIVYGGRMRRYGPDIPEMTHLIWVANRNYNNAAINAELEKAGIDPVLAAFIGLHHDTIETLRDNARREGKVFDQEAAMRQILDLWPEQKDHAIIRAVVLDYMTDRNPKLTGTARILAQKFKPVDPTGDPVIRILNIETRAGDKLHHVLMDVYMRMLYVSARENGQLLMGHMSSEERRRFGLPDMDMVEAARQAQDKEFAVERADVSPDDAACYREKMGYLKNGAEHIQLVAQRLHEKKMEHSQHVKDFRQQAGNVAAPTEKPQRNSFRRTRKKQIITALNLGDNSK